MLSADWECLVSSLRYDTKRKGRPATLDGLFFQGRIVPTEVHKTIRTFWQKSYEGPKASVKEFL